jgi:hypothetical protein
MVEINQREYQAVILGALLHVRRARFIGDVGKEKGYGFFKTSS